jgi:hypothetical protein
MIQEVNDKEIDGDEDVNMEEGIEKDIEEGIEESNKESIEKDIKKNIKEIVEQTMKKIVEEINIEKDIKDSPKFRRNDRNKKQIRKSLTYYRDFREMKNKKSEYKEKHRI